MSESTTPKPFIRLCNPQTDEDAIYHICQETITDPALKQEPALTIAPFLWAVPYVRLSSESSFVLDDGTGKAVGYLIGTADNKSFLARWHTEYLPSIAHDVRLHPTAPTRPAAPEWLINLLQHPDDSLLLPSVPGFVELFPGHLHMNLLPEYQRLGWGRKMMEVFCDNVREKGARGVYLITAPRADAAVAFYGKVGFGLWEGVLDGGTSGGTGRDGNECFWMVRRLG